MPISRIGTDGIEAGAVAPSDLSTGAPSWDGSGNVGIGTSTLTNKLNVAGAIQSSSTLVAVQANTVALSQEASYSRLAAFGPNGSTSGTLYLYVIDSNGGNQRGAIINSSGQFLVGYNAAPIWDELISGSRNTNAVVGGFYSSSNAYTSSVIRCQTETAAGTGWYLFEGRAAGGSFQYGIRGNGTVATSDERRKKNIEPARSYLQDICSIPVVKYNWKTDSDDAPKELGWVAQDVAKVFPNMVVTHHDGPNDDQEVLLLKKEVFLPMLMKCIQEQQQMIETLQAKVAALEAK